MSCPKKHTAPCKCGNLATRHSRGDRTIKHLFAGRLINVLVVWTKYWCSECRKHFMVVKTPQGVTASLARTYSDETMAKVAKMVVAGKTLDAVSHEVGIPSSTIHGWIVEGRHEATEAGGDDGRRSVV